MKLDIALKQSQTLSPEMIQSMEILQMGTQELLEHIQEIQLENPILEEDTAPLSPQDTPPPPTHSQQEWDGQNSWYDQQDWDDRQNRPDFDRHPLGGESLGDHLRSQISASPELSRATEAVIDALDDSGYFTESLTDLSRRSALPIPLLHQGLKLVQTMEPSGVGGENLQHCLLLQLDRLGADDLPKQLIADFLPQLAQSHFHAIAQQTGASREKLQRAVDVIRTLNPKPGASFGGGEAVRYIVPDVYILAGDEGLFVQLREGSLPTLTLNSYYRSLLTDSQDEGVKSYLSNKITQANWLIQGISQRQDSLLRCANFILQHQQNFFAGKGAVAPLLMQDCGSALGIHESTVSRTLRDKYLQCPQGVFPLSHFFSRNVGGEGEATSAHQIKDKIKLLIAHENKLKPLSDQKLCDLLGQEGIGISRRTVTKYRESLSIPSAPGRRKI